MGGKVSEKRFAGASEDGKVEFYEIDGQIYRVSAGWIPDIHGLPMGSRWECSVAHWEHFRKSVYSWVVDTVRSEGTPT